MICSRKQLANVLGAAPSTLTAWAVEGMPVERTGKSMEVWRADSAKCVAWLLERERARSRGDAAVATQRTRVLAAQADRHERENAQAAKDLVSWAEIDGAMKTIFGAMVHSLRTGGGQMVPAIRYATNEAAAHAAWRIEMNRLTASAAIACGAALGIDVSKQIAERR
jgi:hypothetical protein